MAYTNPEEVDASEEDFTPPGHTQPFAGALNDLPQEETTCISRHKLDVEVATSHEEPTVALACASTECSSLELVCRLQGEAYEIFQAHGGILQESDTESWAPNLQTLSYLNAEEVALTILGRLEQLTSNQLSEAYVAEQRLLEWVREWLDLSPRERRCFIQRIVAGSANLSAQTQARYVSILTEMRFGTWELQNEERIQRRVERGRRVGRASLLSMASLESQELDELGAVFSEVLSENLTPIGAARAVVHMDEPSRQQLALVLVHENMLTVEGARKLFRAVSGVIAALGPDKVDAMLAALDAAAGVGSSAIRGSSRALGSLGSMSDGTLEMLGTAGSDALHVAASVGTNAAVNLSWCASTLASQLSLSSETQVENRTIENLQERPPYPLPKVMDGIRISSKSEAPCNASDFL